MGILVQIEVADAKFSEFNWFSSCNQENFFS